MPVDPIPESPSARQPEEESTAIASRLGGGEQLAPAADGLVTIPRETAGIAESLGADVGVADVALASGLEKPAMLEEQTALPEKLECMVGLAIQPPSPQVVPHAAAEVDEVEEIVRAEPQP